MDVVNTSRIRPFVPPVIPRRPDADELRPADQRLQADFPRPAADPVAEQNAPPVNPLAALFQSGAKWAFAGPGPQRADEGQPTVGRFVDVIA